MATIKMATAAAKSHVAVYYTSQVLVDSISIIGLNKIERRLQIILAIKMHIMCSFDSVECFICRPSHANDY